MASLWLQPQEEHSRQREWKEGRKKEGRTEDPGAAGHRAGTGPEHGVMAVQPSLLGTQVLRSGDQGMVLAFQVFQGRHCCNVVVPQFSSTSCG